RLRGNALQPQSGLGENRKQRRAVFGSEANQFVRYSSDDWQQRDAKCEAPPERRCWNQHVNEHRDQHHGHQEAGAAARMEGRIRLRVLNRERIMRLESENCLVLRAVILKDAANIGPPRDAPNEQQEKSDADEAVDHVESESITERWINVFQLGRR